MALTTAEFKCISSEIEDLERVAGRMVSVLDRAESSLLPVLTPLEDGKTPGDCSSTTPMSPIATDIRAHTKRISFAVDRFVEVLDRLEV